MKVFKRRGQAALEFMMTYGWAILVVLAAIGALSYFGVLNPSRLTPDTCLASTGFACPGKPIITNDNITFTIINGLGYTINLDNARASLSSTLDDTGACDIANIHFCPQGETDTTDADCRTTAPAYRLEDGAGITLTLTGCNFQDLNLVKGEIRIAYDNPQSMLPEEVAINVNGKIKRD